MAARRGGATAEQLALELPLELPRMALAPEWKDQQRLWGHPFHPMCSYLASYPAALTHAFIARYSRPGDVVLDPFSGRGTTPLQACAEGRIGVGNDLNPFAHLLTAAKVEPPTRAQAATRLAQLRLAWNAGAAGWLELGARIFADPTAADALVPASGLRHVRRRRHRARAGRGRACLPPADARAAPVRPDDPPARRSDGSVPGRGADRDPPRQERELPLRADAEHVLDGPALRPRFRRANRVRVAGARRVRRAREEARSALPAAAAANGGRGPAGRRTRRRASGLERRSARRAGRTAPDSSSPRRPTCGSSSTATTTGCGRGSSGSTRAPSTPPSTTPTTASRTWRSCARSSPPCDPP